VQAQRLAREAEAVDKGRRHVQRRCEKQASWEGRKRYAVVYPCLGVLAEEHGRRPVPAGLGALVGSARAGLLVLLGTPMSTTRLVAVTGQGLGSVGRHLKVLLDAGLVERGRAGRSVLYSRTAAGNVVVEAGNRSCT
jgi:DNA-binding transcriptional ArsR family regulator